MTRPRSEFVSTEVTPYYHCISRCVRRAYLYGIDSHTGQDFRHRKQWIQEHLLQLQAVFTVNLCAYAIMDNHYHLVIHIDTKTAHQLNEQEVALRWHKLFQLPLLVKRYLANNSTSLAEQKAAQRYLAVRQARLADLSWFMRCLNEHIARKANKEDNCTGRFWEGRFRSQAILDDAGLLACMAYVDLNPLRAGQVNAPEEATEVSLQQRIHHYHTQKTTAKAASSQRKKPDLLPFSCQLKSQLTHTDMPEHIPFSLASYLSLIDWVSRVQTNNNTGYVPHTAAKLLDRMNVSIPRLLIALSPKVLSRGSVIGHCAAKITYALRHRRRCVIGPSFSA